MKVIYDEDWFEQITKENYLSARKIMPIVIELLKPKSIIDFGCGLGIWGQVVNSIDSGILYIGVDGNYVEPEQLKIPKENFVPADLNQVQRLGKFDLVICLETIEHLEPENEDSILDTLTSASDTILFGGAIPGQGGTHHVNERWLSYWQSRFHEFGFHLDDSIRPLIWDDEEIIFHYRQNTVLFKKGVGNPVSRIDLVHPVAFDHSKIVEKCLKNENLQLTIENNELKAILMKSPFIRNLNILSAEMRKFRKLFSRPKN